MCFEHWTRVVFLGTAESFQLRIEMSDKHDIVGKIVNGFKQPKVWISSWAVNSSQNEVLVVRKVNVNHQGFLIGYDIEIYVRYSLLITGPCFTRNATPPLAPVDPSFFIVS